MFLYKVLVKKLGKKLTSKQKVGFDTILLFFCFALVYVLDENGFFPSVTYRTILNIS